MYPPTIRANYRQWRAAIVGAIRSQRRNGNTPRRGAPTDTRPLLAFDLRARRKQLRALAGLV